MPGTCRQCGIMFATRYGALDHWRRTGHNVGLPPVKEISGIQVACPRAIQYGCDEYKCPKCGVIWDRNEPRPECKEDF